MENESQKEEQHITEYKNSLKPNSEKSEKELLASIAQHTNRTAKNMVFFFWVFMISLLIWAFMAVYV